MAVMIEVIKFSQKIISLLLNKVIIFYEILACKGGARL